MHLLDSSTLIALVADDHEHHEAVADWLEVVDEVALCPVVEGSLIRFLLRIGERAEVAQEAARQLRVDPRVSWWPDDRSYADVDLSRVTGYRQVTDAYLVGLASARHALVATLDRRLAALYPEHSVLVPVAV